ncbi:DUF6881 domain-containing protein [Micromonospora zhanjiangensis]|uniref:DUF6881 domain-containing protein n=1 Tax=Micromonospora zhanjiangensis TaxID=1522057 RepID=A0ABV8KHN6_9ACTN
MRYVKVSWQHDFDNEPVLYLSELDDGGYEARKVEFFRDGAADWADETRETETIGLSDVPFPTAEEIAAHSEFKVEEISSVEFEQAWRRVRALSA